MDGNQIAYITTTDNNEKISLRRFQIKRKTAVFIGDPHMEIT